MWYLLMVKFLSSIFIFCGDDFVYHVEVLVIKNLLGDKLHDAEMGVINGSHNILVINKFTIWYKN